MTVLAHSSHWLISLSYLTPMVALLGIILVGKLRDRRAEVEEPAPPETRTPRSDEQPA